MTLTDKELGILWHAISFTEDQKVRNFPLSQLKDAANIMANLATLLDGKEILPAGEYEFEMTTNEKKLCLDSLKRSWSASAGMNVLSLEEKLEK